VKANSEDISNLDFSQIKCGKGKGKGVNSIYPSNTIEVIKEIQKGRLVVLRLRI
jgi:hypothetical protein